MWKYAIKSGLQPGFCLCSDRRNPGTTSPIFCWVRPRIRAAHFFLSISFALLGGLAGCSGGSGNSGGGTTSPAPVVTSVSPSAIPAGSATFTLSVTGSNFQPQAVVNWNANALATTYTSSSALSAAVPANLIATASVANIAVTNPDGQTSAKGAGSQEVSITNPAPTVSSVVPQSLYAGSADTAFSVIGTGFIPSSVVMAGSTALTTTFASANQLTAIAPASLLASAGTLSLSVSNPAPGGGNSNSISVTLVQPPPELDSLSPSIATVGSSVSVTLTGKFFTPTSVLYVNSFYAAATTYVSTTSIQGTIPASVLTNTGDVTIAVRDPASQNHSSNALSLELVNPVPMLSSISPTSVTAGAPNFALTLTGSNFVSSSTVLINGTPVQPNLSPSTTSAWVSVPASAVSAVGTVTVAISNPAPGGGTSAVQTLNVISGSNRIRTMNGSAADLGWDSAHNLLIASTLSGSADNPNSIVTIDPAQGTVITAQPLPGQPAGISVTDDGSFVYVTLPTTGQIERLTLPSLTPDITFALGNDSFGNPYTSNYVAAAPKAPHTVAISRNSTSGGAIGGVVIYDDGVARSTIAYPTGFDNVYGTLTWGSDATTLYGTNPAISTANEDIFSVNGSGVTLSNNLSGALGEFVIDLAFDAPTSRLVDGYGNVVSAATGQTVGRLQVQNTITYEENPFAIDTTQRVAFFLNDNAFYFNESPNGTYIEAFSLDRFNYINSLLLYGLNGGSKIIRWGTSGLAINASSQIYLIDGSFVASSGVSSPVGDYIAASPTLTSVSPATVSVGSPDVQVTLTGRDFTDASLVTWNNQTLLVDSVTDTQLVVAIPGSALTDAVASGIIVTNGPGSGSSNPVAFTVLPNLGATTQISAIDVSGQDLVWDDARDLLYVAVPASDPEFPNTIAVIDPTKPSINRTISVADGPTALSLSDDGQFLYSGFSGQAIVQRYALPAVSLDLTVPISAGVSSNGIGTVQSCSFPVEVKVAPGSPHSIAVTEGNDGIDPRGCGGVAIYDDTTPRPDVLTYGQGDFTTLAWGADGTTLFGQSDSGVDPQTLSALAVSPSGVTFARGLNSGGLGTAVHYDAGTKLLYSDSGVITNPVGPTQVGVFSAGGIVVTDSNLNRAFVLTNTQANNNNGTSTSYTLDIFNLNTRALLNSIVIPDVLGFPTRMARWGSNGLVLVTIGEPTTNGPPGTLYILQGSSISGTQ
jgi:hypothetical protein